MKKINKSLFVVWSIIISLVLIAGSALAASTIGTNMSTTGTFTQTVGSTTAARFQNAAGTTTVLWVDTTNTTVGVNAGGAIDTTFEVGGTASISGITTWADGRLRPQSNGITAFRFQNAAGTTSVFTIDTTNTRAGVNAGGAVDTTFEVGGTASISGIITLADGRARPQSDGTTAFRLQNAAGTTTVFTVDTTNTRAGVNANTLDTTFEVGGTASISGVITLADGQIRPPTNSTTAFRFQNAAGTTNVFAVDTTNTRAGVNAGGAIDTTFEAGGTASVSALVIGTGTSISKHLSSTFSLNFSTLTQKCSDSAAQTVTGAALGDTVVPSVNIAIPASFSFQAFVSTTDSVVFRWCQFGTPLADPDSTGATYRVDVWKH